MTRQLSQLDVALVSYFQKCGLSVFGSFSIAYVGTWGFCIELGLI